MFFLGFCTCVCIFWGGRVILSSFGFRYNNLCIVMAVDVFARMFVFLCQLSGELLRLRDSSLAARDAAALGIEASRAALRDAGSTSAMERLSDLSAPPSPASLKEGQAGGQDVGASLLSIERLSSGDGARSEKWLDEVCVCL